MALDKEHVERDVFQHTTWRTTEIDVLSWTGWDITTSLDLPLVSCLRAPGRTCRRHERERGEDRRGQAKLPFEVHYPLLSPWGETDHISPDS